MARPARWQSTVQTSVKEAVLAVRLYNDPTETRAVEAFVIHMHLAWLYLLHAEFTRDGTDFRHWIKGARPPRLERVDGEPKRWELATCVRKRWPSDKEPVRANLEFFIALRNKIEHRYTGTHASMALALAGRAQALLLNFEEELTGHFGASRSLADRLRFPVLVGTFTKPGEQALLTLQAKLPTALRTFIADYHAGLDPDVEADQRFSVRLRVTQELVRKGPDSLAVQFTRLDDMTDEQRQAVEQMGRAGQVIVREQHRPIYNLDLMKATKACAEVAEQVPYVFNMGHFVAAWKKLKVRPPKGDPNPERTDERYCSYDKLHSDYGYTRAYVKRLVKQCGTEGGFREATGRVPITKTRAA